MFDYKTKVTGDVLGKAGKVVETQQKLYKSLSKLIGDAVTDANCISHLCGADEESTRLATNIMQVMALTKEFVDKSLESNLELAAAIDNLTEKQKDQDKKLNEIIKLLEILKTKKD